MAPDAAAVLPCPTDPAAGVRVAGKGTAMGLFDRLRGARSEGPASIAPSAPRPAVVEVHDPDEPFVDPEVRAHIDRLTAAAGADPSALGPAEFDAALTTRLVGQVDLPDDPRYHYVSPFAEHIAEVLTLDLPGAVVTLREDRLHGHGHAVPTLLAHGRRNLRRLMETERIETRRLGRGRWTCPAFVGDSPYTGSFARFLNEAVAQWLPEADTGNGIIFAVPNRHTVLAHPCATADETRAALDLVPEYAFRLNREVRGQVSPHVYHWYHREISVITVEEGEGTLRVETTPLLDRMVGRVRDAG